MAFFLKINEQKNRTYIAIYESFYSHKKKGTAHRCYKSLQSVETQIKKGIKDPISHFQNEVDKLNKEKSELGIEKITNTPPFYYLGYFPLKIILDKLKVKNVIDLFSLTNNFEYNLYDLMASLIFARSINPCSKHRTFHEVIPNLFHSYNYSYDQLLDGLSFIGDSYKKFIELFTLNTKTIYGLNTEKTYFDCTNFYFEIDRSDDFRKNGPSKENRRSPLVGMGLLLDANQIPIGMKLYPGNESEQPVIRDTINSLKKQNCITGRTIQVADKGLNSAKNIANAKKNGDGYIFSKSVKKLPKIELDWILLENDYQEVKDSSGATLYRYKSCVDKFPYKVIHKEKESVTMFKEKRLITYNPTLASKKKYEINKMIEKASNLTLSQAKKNEYGDSAKYVNFTDEKGKKANAILNEKAIEIDLKLAGYNLLITSEVDMTDIEIYNAYHNLWRIEESFKIMKSDLDARPAYVQKESTIKGHFLICYLTVLLERIFQVHVLENEYSTSEIFRFIKGFKVTKTKNNCINTTRASKFASALSEKFNLPLDHLYLSQTQIKSIFNYKLKGNTKG